MLPIAALTMLALATPAAAEGRWVFTEHGNVCTLTREAGPEWVQFRVTRWRDLSDNILFYRPLLPPLWSEEGAPTGRSEAEERADAEAFYHLDVRIDGRRVEPVGAFNAMLTDSGDRPGPTYRFGIRQQPFLRALQRGRTLELYRASRRLARIPINGLAADARQLAACAAQPTR